MKPPLCGLRTRLGCLLLLACAVTSVSAQLNPQSGMLEQDGWRALETGDLGWARERVRRAGQPLSLAALSSSFGRLTKAEAQLAYATSALAVRRLLDDAGGVAVANLLRDLDEGLDLAEAFLHRMHRPFAAFLANVP